MPRSKGWSVLAMTALELAALGLASKVMRSACQVEESKHPEVTKGRMRASMPGRPSMPQDDVAARDEIPDAGKAVPDPLTFLHEHADPQARYFRAADESAELLAAFYADGRVRLADSGGHRFAGMLENEKADLLDVTSNEWSRLYVRATPQGQTQLEMQGGPYDAHVLTCEPL